MILTGWAADAAADLPRWLVATAILIHSVAVLLGWSLRPIVHAIAARIHVRTLVTHQQVLTGLHKDWPEISPDEFADAISKINQSIAPLNWSMPRRRSPNDGPAATPPDQDLAPRATGAEARRSLGARPTRSA